MLVIFPQNAQPVLLSGIIEARSAFIVAADCDDFEAATGFPPDQCIGLFGPADSNGCASELFSEQGKNKVECTRSLIHSLTHQGDVGPYAGEQRRRHRARLPGVWRHPVDR